MERKYEDYELELDLPSNWFLLSPKKYKDFGIVNSELLEVIEAFAVKGEKEFENVVSFYYCDEKDFDALNFEINIQKINGFYETQENKIIIKDLYDYEFKNKLGMIAIISQVGNEEVYIMQVYFKFRGNIFCFNAYITEPLETEEQLEENAMFKTIKEIIDEI